MPGSLKLPIPQVTDCRPIPLIGIVMTIHMLLMTIMIEDKESSCTKKICSLLRLYVVCVYDGCGIFVVEPHLVLPSSESSSRLEIAEWPIHFVSLPNVPGSDLAYWIGTFNQYNSNPTAAMHAYFFYRYWHCEFCTLRI